MLAAQGFAAQAVEDHHRALDTGNPKLVERGPRRLEGLPLADGRQHGIVARFGTDINHAQSGSSEFVDFLLALFT